MRKLTLSVSGVVSALLTVPVALITSTPGYSQALEEITVTARKTTESLQEVPMAITALTGDDIERLNLSDLSDITQQDTSVQFDEGFTPSDTRITIRGLSPTRGRPNAATLVDGIDLTSEAVSNAGGSTLINPRLVDVQRIEIVKGPQSALYGRSAFAGAIQYITKDPADTLSGDIFVNASDANDAELRGSFSIPISDTLGMMVNAYGWDSKGIYRNLATDDYIGGGNGLGASITVKWEPTDSLGIKWRTELSQDNYDVAPQALLHSDNTLLDLNTVTPNASVCNLTADASGDMLAGFLSDGACAQKYKMDGTTGVAGLVDNETFALNNFFATGTDLGLYDPSNIENVNQYNKTFVSFYQGELPSARGLRPTLNPNYRNIPNGSSYEAYRDADDYDGTDKSVFRTSVKLDWAITDNIEFLSNTGYLDSTVKIQTDIGKYYVDDCSADVGSLAGLDGLYQPYADQGIDPTTLPGGFDSYGQYLDSVGITGDQQAKFAPCNAALGGDGINDASNQFIQDDDTETKQYSQEFRVAWQTTDSLNLVGGVQYWAERVNLVDINSTTIGGGPECNLGSGNDTSQTFAASFIETSALQDQCGNTSIIAAYFMNDTYEGRLKQNSQTLRETDHLSFYGSVDWNLTDKLSFRVEARYVIEDNMVEGSTQTPCLNGELPASWYIGQGLAVPADACNNIQPGVSKATTANGGQGTGPSAVLLCGQVGRCDRLGYAPTAYNAAVNEGNRTNGSQWYAGNNAGSPASLQNYDGPSWWAFGDLPTPGVRTELNRTDRFWAPKATAEYFWNDQVMTYFSWSRGIKPGGFSLLTSGAFGLDANLDGIYDEIEFEPERLDVWEVGYKTTLFDGRVRLNGSFYYQDFKDKQVTVQVVTAGTTGTQVQNISGSQVLGTELDLTIQVTDNLRTQIGYTFLDSEYTDYTITTASPGDVSRINAGNPAENCSEMARLPDASTGQPSLDKTGCVMSFNGNELERAPKHAWLVNLNYTNSLFDTGMEWYSEVNYRYQDKRYMEAFNIVEFQSYSLTDLRFGLLAEKWDVQLYVNNVFDSDTIITGGPNPGIPTGSFGFGLSAPPFPPGINAGPKLPSDIYVNLPNPRIIGLNAKYRFGG